MQDTISAKHLSKVMSNVMAVFHQEHYHIQDTLSAKHLSKAMQNVRAVFHQEHCQIPNTLPAKHFINGNVKCLSSVSQRALSHTGHLIC